MIKKPAPLALCPDRARPRHGQRQDRRPPGGRPPRQVRSLPPSQPAARAPARRTHSASGTPRDAASHASAQHRRHLAGVRRQVRRGAPADGLQGHLGRAPGACGPLPSVPSVLLSPTHHRPRRGAHPACPSTSPAGGGARRGRHDDQDPGRGGAVSSRSGKAPGRGCPEKAPPPPPPGSAGGRAGSKGGPAQGASGLLCCRAGGQRGHAAGEDGGRTSAQETSRSSSTHLQSWGRPRSRRLLRRRGGGGGAAAARHPFGFLRGGCDDEDQSEGDGGSSGPPQQRRRAAGPRVSCAAPSEPGCCVQAASCWRGSRLGQQESKLAREAGVRARVLRRQQKDPQRTHDDDAIAQVAN